MINSEECTDSEWIWGLKIFNKSGLQSETSSCKVNIKAVTLAIFPRDLCFSSELQNLITPNRTVLDSQYSSLSLILSHLVCLLLLILPIPQPRPFLFPSPVSHSPWWVWRPSSGSDEGWLYLSFSDSQSVSKSVTLSLQTHSSSPACHWLIKPCNQPFSKQVSNTEEEVSRPHVSMSIVYLLSDTQCIPFPCLPPSFLVISSFSYFPLKETHSL